MNRLYYKLTSIRGLCISKIHITNKRNKTKKELNVLKSELTHSAFLISSAKFAKFRENCGKRVVIYDIMTVYAMILYFFSSYNLNSQNFFRYFCEKSCLSLYQYHCRIYISNFWEIPPIRYL